jgi:translation initiation factor 2 alpha subunit (eIF-2alpha)
MLRDSAGIVAIPKAFRAGEKQSSETVPITKFIIPPLYVLSTNATDKVASLPLARSP